MPKTANGSWVSSNFPIKWGLASSKVPLVFVNVPVILNQWIELLGSATVRQNPEIFVDGQLQNTTTGPDAGCTTTQVGPRLVDALAVEPLTATSRGFWCGTDLGAEELSPISVVMLRELTEFGCAL